MGLQPLGDGLVIVTYRESLAVLLFNCFAVAFLNWICFSTDNDVYSRSRMLRTHSRYPWKTTKCMEITVGWDIDRQIERRLEGGACLWDG